MSVALIGDAPLIGELAQRLAGSLAAVAVYPSVDEAENLDAAGLAIEASCAGLRDRAETLHRIEHAVGEETLLAVVLGDETLSSLAGGLHDPGRVVGLGAIDAVGAIGLLEVVSGQAGERAGLPDSTAAHAHSVDSSARLRAFLDAAGIRSVAVADCPGRFIPRVVWRYVNEGLALLGEGIPARTIEEAAQQAGMSAGPLALLDALSLDEADRVLHEGDDQGHAHSHGHSHSHDNGHGHGHGHGHHEHEHAHEHAHGHAHGHAHEHSHHDGHEHDHEPHRRHDHGHDHDHAPSARPRPHGMTPEAIYVLEKMAHGLNRMGRHAGRGFYEYDEDDEDPPTLWPGLKVFERRRASVSPADLRDRLLCVQSLEALRCLQEAVIASPADADLASVLGWGFPQSLAGVVGFVDRMGPAVFLQRAIELAERYGERFEPPQNLRSHGQDDKPFEDSPL